MGCFLISNSHFQMGVTVMGFAEHFGLCLARLTIIPNYVHKNANVFTAKIVIPFFSFPMTNYNRAQSALQTPLQ